MRFTRSRIAAILFVVLLVIFFIYLFVASTTKDEKIFVSNILANKVTLSWVTGTPVREWVLVTEKDNRFPRLFKDDQDLILPFKSLYLHYVTLSNLAPNTTYKYHIYQNLKETASGTFSTSSKDAGAKASKMVAGQIFSSDKKTPVAGVIVYLQLLEGIRQSSLLSTLTDRQGNYQANILGAWHLNLKENFKIASRAASLVVVETGTQGGFSAHFPIDSKTQNLPDIILKERQQ